MKLELKALCVGALAATAIAVSGGGGAAATAGGHFVSSAEHTTLEALGNAPHSYAFKSHSGTITCESFRHEGTFSGTTAESIDLAPIYTGCVTQGGTTITGYTYNGCVYRLTVAAGTTSTTEQTMHFVCPVGKVLEFHQPNCLATMPQQTVANAATYAKVESNGKHALTLYLHATFETQYHGGTCVFLGTKQSATMQGTALLVGLNTFGERVSLTAT
ncbi:MAG TPA: hypothetical protein VGB06_00430 [Solirubrobacterales bacterium]|jgi:hypothetical protein